MAITSSDLGGGITTLDVLSSSIQSQSAFQAATPQQAIKIGVENRLLTSPTLTLEIVEEGETKPAGGSLNSIVLEAQKIAGLLVNTTEAFANVDVDALLAQAIPNQLSRKFDLYTAAGTLGNLSDAEEVVVSEWADLHTILGTVNATSFVMSSAFASRILGYKDSSGREYLPQTGGVSNLLGVPVHVFRDSTPLAYVGDFEGQARWGIAVPEGGLHKEFESGIVVEGGVEHNLIQENKIAHRIEAYFAYAVQPSEFRKVTLAPAE